MHEYPRYRAQVLTACHCCHGEQERIFAVFEEIESRGSGKLQQVSSKSTGTAKCRVFSSSVKRSFTQSGMVRRAVSVRLPFCWPEDGEQRGRAVQNQVSKPQLNTEYQSRRKAKHYLSCCSVLFKHSPRQIVTAHRQGEEARVTARSTSCSPVFQQRFCPT
jgi:hypothetical protein